MGKEKSSGERTKDLAHELRTPITAILGYTNLLVEAFSGTPQDLEKLLVIRNHSEYLLRLVNHLLTDPGAGLPVRQQQVDVLALALDVTALMQGVASGKGLTLEVKADGALPQTIQTDDLRLRQVLINLMSNALQYTNEGFVRLTLRLEREPKPCLEFRLEDSGAGMDAEQQKLLFKPFVQVHLSSRSRGGIGLGLSTSMRLARQLGGELGVASQSGQGSTFTLRLPLAGELSPMRLHATPSVPGGLLFGRELLLAAIGGDQLLMTSAILKRQDASITLCTDADAAVQKALGSLRAGRAFAAILIDDTLPDVLGLARRLRLGGFEGCIISLGEDCDSRRRNCREAGCDAVLAKPVDVTLLLAAINRHAVPTPLERP